jgi:prevent-host-death family protein
MVIVNMLDAKSNLSRLVEAVESGAEEEIIIARNGKPAARLVPIAPRKAGKRIGAAQGMFKIPAPDKQLDAQIAKLFTGK